MSAAFFEHRAKRLVRLVRLSKNNLALIQRNNEFLRRFVSMDETCHSYGIISIDYLQDLEYSAEIMLLIPKSYLISTVQALRQAKKPFGSDFNYNLLL